MNHVQIGGLSNIVEWCRGAVQGAAGSLITWCRDASVRRLGRGQPNPHVSARQCVHTHQGLERNGICGIVAGFSLMNLSKCVIYVVFVVLLYQVNYEMVGKTCTWLYAHRLLGRHVV